jgi:hypothetical protein
VSLILASDPARSDNNAKILEEVQNLILDEEAQQFPRLQPKTREELTTWMKDRCPELKGKPGQLIWRFLRTEDGMPTALGLGNAAFRLGGYALRDLIRRGSRALLAGGRPQARRPLNPYRD